MIDIPLFSYVATMSVTPGPNNLMLAASGVNFGLRRTLPHILGVSLGCGLQVAIVAALLAWAMAGMETLRGVLVYVGCAYLLWLAWRQAKAGAPGGGGRARPLGFFGAALFQGVNPKAWMRAVNAALVFLPRGEGWSPSLSLAAVFIVINLPCIALWAVIGDRLRSHLREARTLRLFNVVMAALLAGTALWIVVDEVLAY